MSDIVTTFVNSMYFIPTLVIVTAVGSIIVFKEFIDPEEEDIEAEALEETVRGEVEDVVDLFGSNIKKKVSYGITPIGTVEKAWGFKENQKVEDDDSEESGTKVTKDLYYFKIRPSSFFSRISAWIADDILNFQSHTKYVVVQKDYVYDGEVITIDDRWIPEKMAGVWLPAFDQAADFVKEKAYKEMFESTLETAKESIRSINHLNLKFAQNIQELEKEEELLQKRYGAKGAGMVNEQ